MAMVWSQARSGLCVSLGQNLDLNIQKEGRQDWDFSKSNRFGLFPVDFTQLLILIIIGVYYLRLVGLMVLKA